MAVAVSIHRTPSVRHWTPGRQLRRRTQTAPARREPVSEWRGGRAALYRGAGSWSLRGHLDTPNAERSPLDDPRDGWRRSIRGAVDGWTEQIGLAQDREMRVLLAELTGRRAAAMGAGPR